MPGQHHHPHHHGDHDHSQASERRLLWTALLTGGFMLVEAAGGLVSGSLTLLADAGHMLADFAGLAMAWLAFRFSRWPADRRRTYGFERLQILVAFVNGLVLFVIAAGIVIEAIRRLISPQPVVAGTMLAIAAIGLLVNVATFFVLRGADTANLNVRGAMVHVLGDLFGSAGAIAAALVIMTTGWTPADPLLSVLVAVIVLRSAWYVVRDSGHILLEAAPAAIPVSEMQADLEDHVPGVENVHHVHAWSITQERPMVTLHARVGETADADRTILAIKSRLRARFGVSHATVEIEHGGCADDRTATDPHQRMHRH